MNAKVLPTYRSRSVTLLAHALTYALLIAVRTEAASAGTDSSGSDNGKPNAKAVLYPAGEPTANEIVALVRPDRTAVLSLERNDATESLRVHVRLLPFVSSDKRLADVLLAGPGTSPLSTEQDIPLADGVRFVVLPLQVRAWSAAADYEGRLIIEPSKGEQRSYKVKLSAVTPAGDLVLDTQEARLQYTRPLWGPGKGAQFVLMLRDRDGGPQIGKLRVRPDGSVSGPDGMFSLPDHLSFVIDAHSVSSLWSSRGADNATIAPPQREPEVTIPAGGQTQLRASLHDLPPGEYRFALRFESPDSRPGPEQRLSVIATVRHHWLWPLLVLVLGVAIAWMLAKGISNWRASLQIEQTIAGLDRDWLRDLPSLPAVVWLRAMLRQSSDLVHLGWRVLVPAPEAISARLRRGATLFQLLRDYQRALHQVEYSEYPTMVKYRTIEKMNEIVRDLDDPEAIDDATIQARRTDLARLLDLMATYDRADAAVARRASDLRASVHAEQFFGCSAEEQRKIAALLDTIGPGVAPTGGTFERVRAAVKILNDRRDDVLAGRKNVTNEQLRWLLDRLPANGVLNDTDLRDLFRMFDHQNWDRFKRAQEDIVITPAEVARPGKHGPDPITPVEAYQPFGLRVEVKNDADLSSEFMLKSRIDCTWHFVLTRAVARAHRQPFLWLGQKLRSGRERREWRERTQGNRIIQFAPFPGTLTIDIEMSFDGSEPLVVAQHAMTIESAKEFSRLKAFQKSELVATGLTTLIAVVTGLTSQYLANPAFGAFKDYVMLFLWGAGLDTGKSLLQSLGSTSAPATAASPGVVTPSASSTQPSSATSATPVAQTMGAPGSAPVAKPKGVAPVS